MSSSQITQQFQILLKAFANAQGMPVPEDVSGLEFAVDQVGLMVTQDPQRDDYFLVDVQLLDVSQLTQPLSARVLFLLHQINDAARFEHGWVVTISPDNMLQMHCSRSMTTTSAQELESLVADGIERGESLLVLLHAQSSEPSNQDAEELGMPEHFIRA